MYQVAVKIPDVVLHDTHMTENQSEQLAKKIVAMHYYLHLHISLGYCAQIAKLSEEEWNKIENITCEKLSHNRKYNNFILIFQIFSLIYFLKRLILN